MPLSDRARHPSNPVAVANALHGRPCAVGLLALALLVGLVGRSDAGEAPKALNTLRERNLRVETTFTIAIQGSLDRITVKTLLPQSIRGQQRIDNLRLDPTARTTRVETQAYAQWDIAAPRSPQTLTLTYDVRLTKRPAVTAKVGQVRRLRREERARYLAPEKWIEADAAAVRAAAEAIPDGADDVATARAIHDAVVAWLKPGGFNPKDVGAVRALAAGTGDCTEYADLFVALARAKGLPARACNGILATWRDTPKHSWAEVYTQERGWIPIDTLHADRKRATFGGLENKYLVLSYRRNDPELNHYYFWSYRIWGKGKARVHATTRVINLDIEPNHVAEASY